VRSLWRCASEVIQPNTDLGMWYFWFVLSAPEVAQEKTATSGLGTADPVVYGMPEDTLRDPRETHLLQVKQLSFSGQNAEA